MNRQIATIAMTLAVLSVVLCSISVISEDSDASSISDADGLKSEISSIVNQAKNQSSTTTYEITLSDNATITVDSLLFDFTGISSTVNLNFNMGSKNNGATITINGSESYGMKFINASSSNLKITLKYGTIIDQRSYSGDDSSTLEVIGSGALGGNTTVMTNTLKLESEVSSGTNVSVISMSGGVTYTSNTSSSASSDVDGVAGVRMITSTTDIKSTSFTLYNSSTINVVGDGIVSEGEKLSTITLNKETSVVSESGNAVASSNSKVSVKNMTLSAGKSGVYLESGEIIVTGGSISGKESAIDAEVGVIGSISGGKFNHVVDQSLFEENYACSDYPDSEGYYCLSYVGSDAQAKLDGVGYKNVRDAQIAASMITDRTPIIVLLDDVGLDDGWSPSFSNDIIIDLNGNDWFMGSTRSQVSGISLEITGTGTISSPADVAFDVRGSKDSNSKDYSVLIIGKDVKVVGNTAIVVFPTEEAAYGVRIDIAGTLETIDDSYPLCIQGEVKKTGSNAPVINIESTAIIDGKNGTGIYAAGYGTWDIKGKVYGETGIELRAGALNVFDGAIIEATAASFTETANGSGTTITGAGIAVSQHTSNPSIQVNIHGGEISGLYALYEKDLQNSDGTDNITIDISGGTFTGKTASISSQNVTGFLSGGIFLKENEDGSKSADKSLNNTGYLEDDRTVSDTGGVSLEGGVAKIKDKEYPSLTAAIDEANDGDTISLIKDTTESITILSGKNIIIDLGTFTLTNETDKHTITIESGASLTIVGTGTVDNVSHSCGAVVNNGTFVLESGTLTRSEESGKSPSDNGGNSWYVVDNHGTMVVKGGTIEANGDYSSLIRNIGASENDRASLTIKDGLISNRFNTVKNDDYGDLTITGGTIESERQAVQNWSDAEIVGGTMNGNVHTYTYQDKAASLTIDGNAMINGNLCAIEYILEDESLDSTTDPTVNIKGGTINGTLTTMSYDDGTKTYEALEGGEAGEYAWFEVSGGTFNATIEDRFIADGTIIVPNDDDTYGTITSEEALIKDSGEITTPIVSDGPTYVLTSSGSYNDVTVTIQFPDGIIIINGDFQKGAYTVVLEDEETLAYGMEAGFHIETGDIEIDSITATVEVQVNEGYRLTSVMIYHQGDGSDIDVEGFEPDNFTGDGVVTFTTTTNSHYWFDLTYAPVENAPVVPDDDESLPILPSASKGDDDDSVTIIACAAAAVVAALMAVFLILTYRKD